MKARCSLSRRVYGLILQADVLDGQEELSSNSAGSVSPRRPGVRPTPSRQGRKQPGHRLQPPRCTCASATAHTKRVVTGSGSALSRARASRSAPPAVRPAVTRGRAGCTAECWSARASASISSTAPISVSRAGRPPSTSEGTDIGTYRTDDPRADSLMEMSSRSGNRDTSGEFSSIIATTCRKA